MPPAIFLLAPNNNSSPGPQFQYVHTAGLARIMIISGLFQTLNCAAVTATSIVSTTILLVMYFATKTPHFIKFKRIETKAMLLFPIISFGKRQAVLCFIQHYPDVLRRRARNFLNMPHFQIPPWVFISTYIFFSQEFSAH